MDTYKIHITGIVQGVGFRPLVYNLAKKLKIKGTVSNNNKGLIIFCNSCPTCAETFLNVILEHHPKNAHITNSTISKVENKEYSSFTIIDSENSVSGDLLITPDYAVCSDCLAELNDIENVRFEYPFITCTNCGPRYSIINKLPYDRVLSTMDKFEMCENCETEYTTPQNKRFYSQTNSCADCGIELQLFDSKNVNKPIHIGHEIASVVNALNDGKIIAVKGIGGYLIMVDATNRKAIQTLRERKHRPAKPFALMVLDEQFLFDFCTPTAIELEEWNSPVAPIILFDKCIPSNLPFEAIAPGLNQVGIMKAYTPLHDLICKYFGNPLIATSANLTNSPIIFSDHDAKENLVSIADFILSNTREIVVPQDDSVMRFTKNDQKIIYRRSRGLAPNFFHTSTHSPNTLAVGAMLKSAFAFTQNNNVFISQYLGATDSYETQKAFVQVFNHLSSVLQFKPDVVISDKHPGYFTTEWAEQLASLENIPVKSVQHHEAHFSAILGEHQLWEEKILGFIWDGTGLGNDNQIWGGETMVYEQNSITRVAHLPYHSHILSDKMVTEPRISSLSYFSNLPNSESYLKDKFTDLEWKAYHKLLETSTLKTSSMGRLFDAVSSILNLCNTSTYHGQAAMLLESQAELVADKESRKPYPVVLHNLEIDLDLILSKILTDLKSGVSIPSISAKFHFTLVEIIFVTAQRLNLNRIAFSGGVFQNSFLVTAIIEKLGNDHDLYFHEKLSPNDECIAFGQLMHFQNIGESH